VAAGDNPNGKEVSLFLQRLEILSGPEREKLAERIAFLLSDPAWKSKMANAWHVAGNAARGADRSVPWVKARESARNLGANSPLFPAREAARASGALVVRDLITPAEFEILIAPCRFLLEELKIVEAIAS